MTLSAPYIQCRLRLENMLYLVTFSGMAESEQGSTKMANSRQEEDELMAQMEEDERLLDESDGEDKQSATMTKERATKAGRVNSVGTLVKDLMKNVWVGSNDMFAASASAPASSAEKTASSRAAGSSGTEQASGLPREYEMVKAARRNWLFAVAMSGIGPLSHKIASAGGGFETGSFVVATDQ